MIQVEASPLTPSFISGLCLSDTLKLFSNVNPDVISTIEWRGPDNFTSDEHNPELLNITGNNSGRYTLEVTNLAGCTFAGFIDIEINSFTNPQISTDALTICNGDPLVLLSNDYSEVVEYYWYEGVFPTGELLDQTMIPRLALTPTLGTHFYYVIAQGSLCRSNPSERIQIEVNQPPSASILNPFKTVCEQDILSLSTPNVNPDYTYFWTGPNSFQSNDPNPLVTPSASEVHDGPYTLIIDDGTCSSEPALAQVNVLSKPPKPIIDGAQVYCEGENAVVSIINIPNANLFHWYIDN